MRSLSLCLRLKDHFPGVKGVFSGVPCVYSSVPGVFSGIQGVFLAGERLFQELTQPQRASWPAAAECQLWVSSRSPWFQLSCDQTTEQSTSPHTSPLALFRILMACKSDDSGDDSGGGRYFANTP